VEWNPARFMKNKLRAEIADAEMIASALDPDNRGGTFAQGEEITFNYGKPRRLPRAPGTWRGTELSRIHRRAGVREDLGRGPCLLGSEADVRKFTTAFVSGSATEYAEGQTVLGLESMIGSPFIGDLDARPWWRRHLVHSPCASTVLLGRHVIEGTVVNFFG